MNLVDHADPENSGEGRAGVMLNGTLKGTVMIADIITAGDPDVVAVDVLAEAICAM
ncbi:hypothetical protein J433_11952 [Corynebacterium glutamicum MT]|uniref:Uncharacterized protein n=2 Tax=Corynebacterium glutamicum TaxID=1718 RepID=A0AB72VE35_CORGB|nr:hypothetical protein [Corynebacterium glutamicum]AGN20490.1 hypothetical protein C624_14625 [Corynebacterium glutamicum SCgG1]AGN23515.1 hypothetical protein C629_14635 [Corynebacterium glutamicum SCgG2]EGV41076.1 hypothetical protein CgS9114_03695 [Corynebacterium glutamicum S9114]EOA64112.1 hypothetical protein J433_11952 [Corynebacterium glutamicum MT]EPP39206.1 hypothetical protein A583_14148 [Corynebacterium glutamicum Z188]